MIQIFISGASITYGVGSADGGWADMVKRYLHKRQYGESGEGSEHYEVYNFAKPGATVEEVRDSMTTDVGLRRRQGEKSIIILSVGMNNAKCINSPNSYVSTIDSYKTSLNELLGTARNITDNVIFVGYTPVDEKLTAPRISPLTGEQVYFFNNRIKEFNSICKAVCGEMEVIYVDIFDKANTEGWKDFLVDGVHPNVDGHGWIFNQLKPYLERAIQS